MITVHTWVFYGLLGITFTSGVVNIYAAYLLGKAIRKIDDDISGQKGTE